MIYVEIPHVDDNDADLFRFKTLEDAVEYLRSEKEECFTIASEDARNNNFEPEDYTLIEVR